MTFKPTRNLKKFLGHFKITFFVVLLKVLILLLIFSPKAYSYLAKESVYQFWACVLILFVLFGLFTFVLINPDFSLINCTVTEFTIDGEYITLTTAPFKLSPFINKPSFQLKLMAHEFSRDKINYPARVFPHLKYLSWELRTDEVTVYIIEKYYTAEAIEELEKFLYWKSVAPQPAY